MFVEVGLRPTEKSNTKQQQLSEARALSCMSPLYKTQLTPFWVRRHSYLFLVIGVTISPGQPMGPTKFINNNLHIQIKNFLNVYLEIRSRTQGHVCITTYEEDWACERLKRARPRKAGTPRLYERGESSCWGTVAPLTTHVLWDD